MTSPSHLNAAALANALLDAAAQVEADENRIKQALLAAARAGDCGRVIDIVTRWQSMPAAEVMEASKKTP